VGLIRIFVSSRGSGTKKTGVRGEIEEISRQRAGFSVMAR